MSKKIKVYFNETGESLDNLIANYIRESNKENVNNIE